MWAVPTAVALAAAAAGAGAIDRLAWPQYAAGLRQSLGMEAVRYGFGQGGAGYRFDEDRQLWKVLRETETGGEVEGGSLVVGRTISLTLGAITGQRLPAGRYRVTLRFSGAGGLLDLAQYSAAGEELWRRQLGVSGTFEQDFELADGVLRLTLAPIWGRPALTELVIDRTTAGE